MQSNYLGSYPITVNIIQSTEISRLQCKIKLKDIASLNTTSKSWWLVHWDFCIGPLVPTTDRF